MAHHRRAGQHVFAVGMMQLITYAASRPLVRGMLDRAFIRSR
jgi:hypothetical protein